MLLSSGQRVDPVDGLCGGAVALACHDATHLHLGISAQFALPSAFGVLTYCFLISDFSVIYVAQHSYSLLSWELKLAAVWGGHEGSLLLWVLLLSAW
ncbi:hypothetical protein ACLBR5_30705 [Escherichia coli]